MLEITMLQNSPLYLAIQAARICYLSENKSDEDNIRLLKHVISKDHTSVLEHIVFTFHIRNISRGCLHQLVRHRLASYSVQSTRYTLKKILKQDNLNKLIIKTGDKLIDANSLEALRNIKKVLENNDSKANDLLKYNIPESLAIELMWTINARSIRNFFRLRTSKTAHWEIRNLALTILKLLYDSGYEVLFEDIIKQNKIPIDTLS